MSKLIVYWDQQTVGAISRHPQGKITFQYDPLWLLNKGKQISLSLPCRPEKFPPGISTAFFENLFPENETRTILAFNNRFNKNDTFAFLEYFGQDCAGALSIIQEGKDMGLCASQYRCIDNELKKALNTIRLDPNNYKLFPEMTDVRLSIAGAQDKLPVYFNKNSFSLPENSASPSTHIIKPASPYFPNIQRNEAFCMDLAFQVGLVVPKSQLYNFEGHELFLVERYDRQCSENIVKRLHQEDFCQAMGLPFNRKYQESGGPGFLDCRELIEEYLSENSTSVKQQLTSVMAFNFLIGNNDAHAKNFSILHCDKVKIAPFYDLISTQVYPGLDRKLAMSIGKTYRHDRINETSLTQFSRDMKYRPEKTFEIIENLTYKVEKKFDAVLASHEKQYGKSKIYSDLQVVIQKNLVKLQGLINNFTEDQDNNDGFGPRI